MKYTEMIDRVRELGGEGLSVEQASKIVTELIQMTTAEVDYPDCRHSSEDMLRHYGKTGTCGICIDQTNRKLIQLAKTAPAGAAVGSLMVGALASHAMANRFVAIIRKYGKCPKCGVAFFEPRRHGCALCREDRSWLTRMTKRAKSK